MHGTTSIEHTMLGAGAGALVGGIGDYEFAQPDELTRRTGILPARIYAHNKLHRQIGPVYDYDLWNYALKEFESRSRLYKKM